MAPDQVKPDELIKPSEWRRRRKRMDIGIAFCFAITSVSWLYGAIFNGTNGIVASLGISALAGGLGLIANYHWAATKDDGNRMAQLKELIQK